MDKNRPMKRTTRRDSRFMQILSSRPTGFLPSAAPRRHFDDPADKAGAILGGGLRGGEEANAFDPVSGYSIEFIEVTTARSIDHDPRIRWSGEATRYGADASRGA